MTDWLNEHYQTLINLFLRPIIFLFIAVVAHYSIILILKRLIKRFDNQKRLFASMVCQTLRLPLLFFIWFLAIRFIVHHFILETGINIKHESIVVFSKLFSLTILLWFMLRIIKGIEKIYLEKQAVQDNQQRQTIQAISRLSKIFVGVVLSLVGLQTAGIPITGLVAFGGIGAAGIAFAAQDIIGNFLGGLMIYLNRPFIVNDWINSPDRQIEGSVEKIGWLLTRIRSFDRRAIYVPNGIFSKIIIVNPSQMLQVRIQFTLAIRHQDVDKVPSITEDIRTMLGNHSDAATDLPSVVNLQELTQNSLNILVNAFIKRSCLPNLPYIQQDILLKSVEIARQHGAEPAFQTITLHPYSSTKE